MALNIENSGQTKKINNINRNSGSLVNVSRNTDAIFVYQNGVPFDKFVTTPIISDDTKSLLHNMTEYTGIKEYSPILIKDNNIAIKRSRESLIDLIKYYEGDRRYFYEAYTTPYKDIGGHNTVGFGEISNIGNRTQEEAYAKLCKNLKTGSDELRKYLNQKCGKGTYDNLPESIKEGLLDLWINKGLPGVKDKGNVLTNALKNKDYSEAIINMEYVYYLDKTSKKRVETEGLYKRSLSRMLLASRDLSPSQKASAMTKIKKFYNLALDKYKNNGTDFSELEDIMNNEAKNVVSAQTYYELKADSAFKGRGTFSFIESAFKTLKNKNWNEAEIKQKKSEFKEEFMKLNNNPQSIIIGNTYKIPILSGTENSTKISNKKLGIDSTEILSESVDTTLNENANINTNDNSIKESSSWLKSIFTSVVGASIGGYAGYKKAGRKGAIIGAAAGIVALSSVTKLIKSIFNSTEPSEIEPKTAFQMMLRDKNTTVKKDGNFNIVTTNYKVSKGDNLYRISKKYNISIKTLINDNNIQDENVIYEGQELKITKLGYEVNKNERINDIAKKFGISEEILRDINSLEEGEEPKESEIIEVPGFIHYVSQGENLYKISKEVGVSIEKLKEINGLSSNTIHPYDWKTGKGDMIKIIFDNSDFDVPESMRKEVVDEETKTKTTLTNVSNKYKKDFEREDILPEVRTLLSEVRRVNNRVAATRKVFTAENLGVKIRTEKLKGKTIIINAGHGYKESGVDRGTPASCDMNDEWLVNANNAIRLTKELCANGAKVIYLQGKRDLITDEINKSHNKADMFISVHANSANPDVKDRTMFFYREKDVSGSPKKNSIKLANIAENNFDVWIPAHEIIKQSKNPKLDERFFLNNKQDYAQISTNDDRTGVLKAPLNNQHIPGIIWEVGFMTSKKGQERLNDQRLMTKYAQLMSKSVIEYFN